MVDLSFVTNATAWDGARLGIFIPHALRVFGEYLREIVIVVDHAREDGRIRKLHADASKVSVIDRKRLQESDSRIRIIDLDYNEISRISEKWFRKNSINRCQDGTPIYAFLYGIEHAISPYIIRSDCDIFFYDHGFLGTIYHEKDNYDLIQLPLLSGRNDVFSTRTFFINRTKIYNKLPIKLLQLDCLRSVHRWFYGRSRIMALEQILEFNIKKGVLNSLRLDNTLGATMHIAMRQEFENPDMKIIADCFMRGNIPSEQRKYIHDYQPHCWHRKVHN